MAKKRPTRRRLVGIDLATGEELYEDVTDLGDVVAMFDEGDVEQLRALFEEGMTFEEFSRDYANEKEDIDYLASASYEKGNVELVRLLVEQGADPDQWQDGTGATAFRNAVQNRDRELLEYLVTVIKSDQDREQGKRLLKAWKKRS